MAYTFLKAQGYEIGTSLCEEDKIDYAKEMLEKAKEKGVNFYLPVDSRAAAKFAADAEVVVTEDENKIKYMREEVAHKEIENLKLNLKRLGFSQEEIIELVISNIREEK